LLLILFLIQIFILLLLSIQFVRAYLHEFNQRTLAEKLATSELLRSLRRKLLRWYNAF